MFHCEKIKAWQRSRKLALGVAFALGCSMAVGASAAEVKAPITGDATVDTAFADYITSNSSSTTYNFDKDITIKVDSEVNAPLQLTVGSNSYDIVHGIAATKTNANYLYLNPNGNTITLDVTAHGDTIGAGIFASDARQAINTSTDSSGNYNITVTGSADNTQKSYGIWRAITNTTNKSFYVNNQRDEVGDAKINITVKNDNGGYGVAVSTPDGAGMVKSNGSTVYISGNVNINVSENKKATSALDNSAGLYVDTTNSKITINGKANLDVAGNGIVLDSEPGSSKIEVTKGGTIRVAPSTDGSERYAIYDNGGIVYYGGGAVSGLNGYNGAVAKGSGTQIDGDIYLGDSSNTILWLALSGNDAYLKGAIKEAGAFGNVSMALNDGAVWYNSAANTVNKGTDTVITKIAGNNGTIYQGADSGNVTLQDVWSNSLNIAYEHDKADPSKILGGNVTIEKASADNKLNVFTDYDTNMNTASVREAVLNALTNKIYYTGYINGEDKIDGYVSIAEGLTTSSATKYLADMSFDKTTGQGYLDKNTEVKEATDAGEQQQAEFDKAILGSTVNKAYYTDAGVYKDGVYSFTKDTTITPENNSVVAGPWLNKFASGIFSSYNDEAVTVDMNGKKLTLKNVTDQSTTGMAAVGPTGKVEINNAGPMDIYAESTEGGQTAALFVNGGGQLFIHNGGEDAENKILTLHGKTTYSTNGAVVKSMNGVGGERSWLKIDGLVDIEADTTDGVGMAEGLSAVASTIEIGGGRIIMSAAGVNPGLNFGDNATNCAIRAYGEFQSNNRGIVNVNVIKDEDTATGKAIAAGNNRTQISGNFNTVGGMGTKGTINVGLNTADSYWIGNYINGAGWGMTPGDYGAVNLFMGNGAQWKGYSKFATNVQMDSGATWEGFSLNKAVSLTLKNGATWYNNNNATNNSADTATTLKNIKGGASLAEAGFIDMTADGVRDTTADNYSGYTKVIYKRDAAAPTTILGGNFTVGNAEKGSYISLLTDSDGLGTSESKIQEALGNLANKLYYTGATTGEDNILSFVSINDSLKGNSTQKRVGSVSFDATTGQGQLDWVAAKAQTKLAYDEAITGDVVNDINYVKDGVLDIDSKEYNFTKTNTMLTVDSHNIAGGPYVPSIAAAISGADGTNVKLNLNGKRLNVTGISKGNSTGIAAIGTGTVEVNNAGAMSITANGGGQTAAIFANGGGQVTIHNGDGDLEKKVLTARANATNKANGAVIKTMNSKNGVTSRITIDGLVDVLADGVNSNEAVSAVASTIDIGGGRIEAQGDAWAAIRAYGEFVSPNVGTVNFNVEKDADGKVIGAGDKRAVVIGDVVTNGGMGTRGQVNLGFAGENSYWEGNYADNVGYGVTPEQLGSVNVFLEDGAHWKGFANGSMNVQLDGAKTNWYGFNTSDKLALTLTNGATWYNAITSEQKDNKDNIVSAKVGYLKSDNGFIDMTGDRVFTAESKSLSGSSTQGKASSITESTNGITGDVVVNNYEGNATVFYKHVTDKDGISISGGNFTIKNAAAGSKITLSTDNDGIDVDNIFDVKDALGGLAQKLFYLGYVDGERNLDGYVQIAEGLTTRSAAMRAGDVKFDETTGQGSYDESSLKPEIKYPNFQTDLAYSDAVTGDIRKDIEYVKTGVLNTDTGKYNFTQNTKLDVANNTIVGGPWMTSPLGVAISGGDGTNVQIDLNGKDMEINAANKGHSTGISAINSGIVEIANAGAMKITAEGTGQTAGLFANGGGQLTIHNGDGDLEKRVLTVRANASVKNNGAVIKTMNGKNGATSHITIDGLVDVLADGVNSNEAVSAVASTIDIGGGRIEAQGDAWAAIRAYGEFVSPNVGTVNFNVVKDEDGKVIGAGDKRAVVIGDVVTNGGMGTRGQVSMGFKGENSYWEGNYADNVGYGVTPDQLGSVNVFLEDGAHWKGFGNGSMNVQLDGAKTNWYGFNTSEKLALTLKNGATWYNAITADQTDTNGNIVSAKVGYLTSDNGFIDMTGDRVFKAEGKSLSGSTTQGAASWITESENGITGDVVVDNFAGNVTVIYGHEQMDRSAGSMDIIGGNFTIKSAAEGSKITMSTDNDGIDTSNPDELQDILGKLANKLIYTGAAEGTENNLDGFVQIAEGLTSSSAALKVGSIDFSAENGQGSLQAGSIVTPDNKKNPDVIYGDKETAMMKGAKTAMASSALMWRAESNDLMKRMGDLRLAEGESGIWAKYYGGKYSMDGQNTDLSVKYNAYQVGYDREIGHGWLAGVALSYNDGSSSYGSGRADLKGTSLGVYGTWKGDDGQYVDLIAKYSRLENEFDVRNAYGHKLSGDYKTWGASLSAEYGKRFEMDKGFYVDPSVELTLGRVAAKDYTAGSDYLDALGKSRNLSVEQDAFTSFIGRVGVRLGQKADNASYFVKLAAAHEFSGDFDSAFRAAGEADGRTSIDFGDTWYEAQLGGSVKLNDNSMVYASFERSFGGDVEQKWRVDAGLRWSF